MRGGGRMATAAGPSCGPSAQGVKPPSVLRPGCCCYMQEIAPVDYWHQAHISSLGGPRHFGTGPGLTHLFGSRFCGKLSLVICFIPVPASCDIDLWFFIRVVVDHNHTKLCEATLSYQSLLPGIWLRDHVSCTDSQACCRPFRHMPSHRERSGKVFWEFY